MADDLAAARVKTVRDHMALECVQDWDGVIATFQHPRYEMHGTGAVYDGETGGARLLRRVARRPSPT